MGRAGRLLAGRRGARADRRGRGHHGKSTREKIAVAEAAGATVVGAAAIINRGGGVELGVPFTALATVSFPTWRPIQVPEWLAAVR